LCNNFDFGKYRFFVLPCARHIDAAAVDGKDQPSLDRPRRGEQLRHSLPKGRRQRLSQGLGPFARHFDERPMLVGKD